MCDKKFSTKESADPDDFIGEFYQIFREKTSSILHKVEISKGGTHPYTPMRLAKLWNQNLRRILEKKITGQFTYEVGYKQNI